VHYPVVLFAFFVDRGKERRGKERKGKGREGK
jgi:hypothetical protein